MKVYEILRQELLTDDLIAGQPSFSAEYMRKVRASTDPGMAQVTGDVQHLEGSPNQASRSALDLSSEPGRVCK